MDGIFINGRRPKSKKEVKEAIQTKPESEEIESTSMFGGYSGPVSGIPVGKRIDFVGPNPYSDRKFYGNIWKTETGSTVK